MITVTLDESKRAPHAFSVGSPLRLLGGDGKAPHWRAFGRSGWHRRI
jgi:hypothetical protein